MTSIAQAYVEILPSARGMGRALQGEMGGVESTLSDGTRRGFLGGFANLAAPLAAVIGGLGIGRMIGDSITAASDLSETRSAVMTVFGDAGGAVQAFASTASTALGMTQQAALEGARTFGIFGQAAGLSGGDLSSFSTDLVGLATDFASFNNVEPEVAIQAIGAGLRGESEPLRQFGILLDDAALRARALELGIYDGNGALTQQQRVMAAQAEIFAQAGVQAGDFARTSDGLANQQRILQAGWGDLSASMGSLFLPVVTQIVSFLNAAVMPALTQFMGFLSAGGGGEFFTAITGALGPLIPAFMQLWTSLSPVSLLFQGLLPHLPVVAALMQQIGTVLISVLATALTAVAPLIEMVVSALSLILGAILPLVPALLQLVTPLLQLVGAILPPLVTLFMAVLQPILDVAVAIIGALVPVIVFLVDALTQLITFVVGMFTGNWESAWAGIGAFFEDVWANISSFFQSVWAGIVAFVGAYLATVRSIITGALSFIQSAWNTVWSTVGRVLSDAWNGIVNGVQTGVGNVVSFVQGLPGRVLDVLGNLGGLLVNSGRSLIQGFIDGIRGMIGAVGDAVGGVMDFVAGFFPNSPAAHGPLSGAGWRAIGKAGGAIEAQLASGFTGGIDDVIQSRVSVPRVGSMLASVAAGVSAGSRVMEGRLYLDSGEFLGVVRGQIDDADARSALEVRQGAR